MCESVCVCVCVLSFPYTPQICIVSIATGLQHNTIIFTESIGYAKAKAEHSTSYHFTIILARTILPSL